MLMPFLDGKRAPAFFVYSAIIKFRDKKGICTMRLPFKHNVRVEPDKQLIITMGNHNGGSGPWVKLNISPKEALFMAHNMEKALEAGFYAPMDSCSFCGEEFTKTKEILMLDEERFVHSRCFHKEHENRGLTYSDIKDWRRWFPHDAPKFEYSNLESRFDRIKYAVQVVSKTVIHLYVRPAGASTNKHFILTYDEAIGLIQDIREKTMSIELAKAGECLLCRKTVFLDQDHYEMTSGELVHGHCMEKFVRSKLASQVTFPAKFIKREWIFNIRYHGYYLEEDEMGPFPRV